jgi:hypothetical protein
MQENRPAGVLLLLLVAALLLTEAASPAWAHSGRIVISHAAATMSRRRLEDEVAPELRWAAGLLGGGIGESGLHKEKQVCVRDCAAPCPGCSYTRPCTYEERCRH